MPVTLVKGESQKKRRAQPPIKTAASPAYQGGMTVTRYHIAANDPGRTWRAGNSLPDNARLPRQMAADHGEFMVTLHAPH